MFNSYPSDQPLVVRDVELRIVRRLPVDGTVTVKTGERVEPGTVVAVADQPGRPFKLNVAREFGLDPAKASKRLAKQPGATLAQGETLAKHRVGLRVKKLKSPAAGTFVAFDQRTGAATIVPGERKQLLHALVAGTVSDVEATRGVTIRAFGSRLQGAFGFGEESFGVLRVLSADRQQPLTAEQIDSRAARSIVVAGGTVNAESLRRAVDAGVKGIIAGSIEEPELLAFLNLERRSAWRVGLPHWQLLGGVPSPLTVVVTEGFGQTPMTAAFYDALVASNGGQVSLSAVTRLANGLSRPQIFLYGMSGRDASTRADGPVVTVGPGTIVRLADQDHLGAVGTVQDTPARRRLDGDLVAEAVLVQLAGGTALVVPISNLEVLV